MMGFLARQLRGENTPWAHDYGAPVEHFTSAYWLVRAFYVATLYMAYEEMSVLWRIARSAESIEPLWPVFWVSEPRISGIVILTSLVFAGLLGVLFTSSRLVRLLVFVTILEATAYRFSFGAINHANHFWLWTAFCFAFLPSGSQEKIGGSVQGRQRYLMVFFAAQGLILTFYTLSGLIKAAWGLHALVTGGGGSFSPFALATLAAHRLLLVPGEASIFGPLLINNPWFGWPIHLLVIYVEVVAILIIFRPELHRLWGTMLIVFHVGTFLLLGIAFARHMIVLSLLFVLSPFAPRFDFARAVAAVPGIDWLISLHALVRGGSSARKAAP
ncbi:MAG: hypothetical protein ACTSX7_01105 [Alphaproteobacteria bacterium]